MSWSPGAVVRFRYVRDRRAFWTLPVNLTLVYLLVLLSFVVVVGWLGQISVAQGAFVAVGGAGAAICANTVRAPVPRS